MIGLLSAKRMVFGLICFANTLFSQDFNKFYSPIQNYRPNKSIISEISLSYKNEIKTLRSENTKAQKAIKESLNELSDNFIELDSMHLLMHNDILSNYLSSIVEKIKEKNEVLENNNFKIFLYRTFVPNASSRGNGVILVNLDLLCKLNSEAEIAFILCHEIAHDIEEHVEQGIKQRYEVLYDKKNQKEIKNATAQEFNRNKSTEAVYNKILSKFSEHSRENETIADSIGFLLFAKSGYAPNDAIKTIINLDSIDNELYKNPIDFNSCFNITGFVFDQDWLNPEKGTALWESAINYKTPDSLKTHPDCKYRAEAIERIIKNTSPPINTLDKTSVPSFNQIKIIAQFEYIEHALNRQLYGYALYCALQLQQQFKTNQYLKCVINNCLYEIYVAQIKHTFSEKVDFPNKRFPKAYNQLLYFLHNVNSTVVEQLCSHYYNQHVKNIKNNEYASYVELIINGQEKYKEEFLSDIKLFETLYPKSNYHQQLNQQLNSKKLKPKN